MFYTSALMPNPPLREYSQVGRVAIDRHFRVSFYLPKGTINVVFLLQNNWILELLQQNI